MQQSTTDTHHSESNYTPSLLESEVGVSLIPPVIGGTGMTERHIPHIRDIFQGDPGRTEGSCQDLDQKKKKSCSRGEQPDLKHLDRHLSMKKTIRKKIMRDLQQAFVTEANEKEIVVDTTGREGFLEVLRKGGKEDRDEIRIGEKEEDKKQGFWRRFTIRRNKR